MIRSHIWKVYRSRSEEQRNNRFYLIVGIIIGMALSALTLLITMLVMVNQHHISYQR
jgi:hypothetical protein